MATFETLYRLASRALTWTPAEREACLKRECGEDAELYDAVVRLLTEVQNTPEQEGYQVLSEQIHSLLMEFVDAPLPAPKDSRKTPPADVP